MKISKDVLLDALMREFSEAVVASEVSFGMLSTEIQPKQIKRVIHYLKELGFGFLTDICGIHQPENKSKELGVIYHLHHLESNFRIRLKCFFPKENALVESITNLFAGANWMERETYDFYGISFTHHPNLKIILNADDLGYHPMLKEYPLEDATRTDKDDTMFGR